VVGDEIAEADDAGTAAQLVGDDLEVVRGQGSDRR
jgi:hypothetical protein